MIDAKTNRVIDMLESRDTEDVTKWLKAYKNIKVVVRDGSIGYRAAINAAHPTAIQVNDRFHLIKNLVRSISKSLKRTITGRIEIPLTSPEAKLRHEYLFEMTRREKIIEAKKLREKGHSYKKIAVKLQVSATTATKYCNMKDSDIPKKQDTKRGKQHKEAINKVNAKIEKVKKLHAEGYNNLDISKLTGISTSSIKNYLVEGYNPVHGQYGSSRPGPLTPFKDEILTLRAKGVTYKKITEGLRSKGYKGSVSALRLFVSKEKRIAKDLLKDKQPYELIDKRLIYKLLYKPIEKIKSISKKQLDEVLKKYPIISKLLTLLSNFKDLLSSRQSDGLSLWMKKARELELKEITSFVTGIGGDYDSVKNAIDYSYNNGLAEGSVNKIKTIKRIMYGRNHFTMLRSKVLQLEALK